MDRSWVIQTDYDLTSTYIACSSDLGDALCVEEQLETIPVRLTTRVDDDSDHLNKAR